MKKNLVIGCGGEIAATYGGFDALRKRKGCWYPLGFHSHKLCDTIDINPTVKPDFICDITSSMFPTEFKAFHKKFHWYDLVVLENLPTTIFRDSVKLATMARHIHFISSSISKIFIPRSPFPQEVSASFEQFGFIKVSSSHDMSTIFNVISSFICANPNLYIMRNSINNKLIFRDIGRNQIPFLLLKKMIS